MKKCNTFTIHTELIDGDLNGARNIYMGANKTCHLYVIPRDSISLVNDIDDIKEHPAFYILLGDIKNERCEAYIGHTTDFANRKNDHLQKKNFWAIALVFISDNHKIYGDSVRYLEYLGIKEAQNSTYTLLNESSPKEPNIAHDQINDMEVFFRDIKLLCEFYGCRIFSTVNTGPTIEHSFYIKTNNCSAQGIYDEKEGTFILKKGSIIATETSESFSSKEKRDTLIQKYCNKKSGQIVLQNNIAFDSPSGASGFVLGRSSNGWNDWKDNNDKRLDEVFKRDRNERG